MPYNTYLKSLLCSVSCCLVVLSLGACKSTAPPAIDYDTNANFSLFKSFTYQQDSSHLNASVDPSNTQHIAQSDELHMTTSPEQQDQLNYARIKHTISQQLLSKSMRESDSSADLNIKFYLFNQVKPSSSSVSIGVGGSSYGSHSSTGLSLGTIFGVGADDLYTEITIDMHHQNKLVWRGRAGFTTSVDTEVHERIQKLDHAVQEILKAFPPK